MGIPSPFLDKGELLLLLVTPLLTPFFPAGRGFSWLFPLPSLSSSPGGQVFVAFRWGEREKNKKRTELFFRERVSGEES